MAQPDPDCLFCKIVAGAIPSRKVYEDAELLAFHDIHPWAPVHVLIIPKVHIATLADVGPEHDALLGRMLGLAPQLMKQLGVHNGFRSLINTGPDGHQEVYHLHLHVMGGPRPWVRA
ncbi:MAG: histidine triad nucleotide-binding protein [Rubrivivax sp.]|nr:histidine triad nucleotide-binding protein [Rubrivivax sp.]